MTELYTLEDPGCLTLSEDMMDERDFKSEEAIEIDTSIVLPKSFSLGKWIYQTNYQNGWGSCTANSTSHGVQVLVVKGNGVEPTTDNIFTPDWRQLWEMMGHDLKDKNDSGDYVEKAVSTAYKNGISNVEGGTSKIDGYCYSQRAENDSSIETMKRYLYAGCPIVWCMRGNKTTWNELSAGQLKTIIPARERTGGHAICLVGWDEGGLWFINSWKTNDGKGLKSRFYVPYDLLKKAEGMFNWRYWILFLKKQAKQDPEYIKRKNEYAAILKLLKKTYPNENSNMQKAIEDFSKVCRKEYPEINDELPI